MTRKDFDALGTQLKKIHAAINHSTELWDLLTKDLDTQLIGAILLDHLIVEHYMDDYIKYFLPKQFEMESAGLSFSQKMKLLKNDPLFTSGQLNEGVIAMNAIRNGIAHKLNQPISETHLVTLVKVVNHSLQENRGDY
jgi:hypothetical protein